jgi:hypothetical protein
MDYKEESDQIMSVGKKFLIGIAIFVFTISIIGFLCSRAVSTVDTGMIRYEEFQEISNTCDKLNIDLCNMEAVADTDPMFAQFSKAQRINTIKTNLNRWVQDYNAKSKLWNHSMWKSNSLPYQLDVNQFNCYNSK